MATLLTMPLDVVKTRRQVESGASPRCPRSVAQGAFAGCGPASTAAMVARILQTEGPRALLAGLIPRLAKMAPSCAIMIATFEAGKKWVKPERR